MDRVITNQGSLTPTDLMTGAAILVDKPLEWTSFDVVNKLRWALKNKTGIKRYKVGHAGTLDPLATGLLIICISKYTKLADSFQAQSKSYSGEITLHATTPTYDAEMEPDVYFPRVGYNKDELIAAANEWTGQISQLPPIYSALKKDGVPLYKLARNGKKVEVSPRSVSISRFDLVDIEVPKVGFEVDCSKGTYIRSLAYDFGLTLGTGAYLSSLRRNAIGDYNVIDAWELNDLVDHINSIKTESIET